MSIVMTIKLNDLIDRVISLEKQFNVLKQAYDTLKNNSNPVETHVITRRPLTIDKRTKKWRNMQKAIKAEQEKNAKND